MHTQDLEHILHILTLAETAERIGIVLGPESGDADLLAAHALKEKLGPKAGILNAPEHLQDRWVHMFKKERPRKEFALELDTAAHPVEELRYEKEGGKLRIFLSPAAGTHAELTKDAFSLEQRHAASDMIIAFGFGNEDDLHRIIETDTPLKNSDALINLSTAPTTQTPLETQSIISPAHRWDLGAMKLWSRALLRSYTEDNAGVFWAFLPKEDFQKTEQSADNIPALVADMRAVMQLPPLCIVLWQDQQAAIDNVHIFVSGTDRDALMRLAQAAETTVINGTITIRGFANFSEAEVEMRKLLKSHSA